MVEGGADAGLVVATGLMDTFGVLAGRLGVPCFHAWWSSMIAAAGFIFAASERFLLGCRAGRARPPTMPSSSSCGSPCADA